MERHSTVPAISQINLSGVMLKTRKDRVVLEPYGYEGSEEHFIPLASEFISCMNMEEKYLEVQLPRGVSDPQHHYWSNSKYRFNFTSPQGLVFTGIICNHKIIPVEFPVTFHVSRTRITCVKQVSFRWVDEVSTWDSSLRNCAGTVCVAAYLSQATDNAQGRMERVQGSPGDSKHRGKQASGALLQGCQGRTVACSS